MSTANQVAKATGLIVGITVISKITGFFRTVVLADVYGANCLTDSYVAATVYPSLLFSGINLALTTTFIPLYTDIRERSGSKAAYEYANIVLTTLLLALVLLEAVGFLTALPILPLYVPGWVGKMCHDVSQLHLTLELTWVMMPALIFIGLAGVQTGILEAEGDFAPAAFIGIPQNLILIAIILWLSARLNIFAAAIGTLLGGMSFVIVQGIPLHRRGFRFRPRFGWNHPELRRMGRMVIPVFLSTFVSQAGYIVDRILASGLANGSISALQYASLINNVVLGVFVTALVTVMYPTLSRFTARGDVAGFINAIRRALGVLILVTVPVSVGIVVLRTPLVRVIFQHGAFTPFATAQTAFALLFFALGLVANSAATLLPRAFFALKDTRTPTIYGLGAVAVNIVADLLLVHPLAQGGLALGTSLAQWAITIILLWQLRKRVGALGGFRLMTTLAKSIFAGLVMGLAVDALYTYTHRWLPLHQLPLEVAHLGLVVLVGAGIYAMLVWLLKIEEVSYFLDLLRLGLNRLRTSI